MHERQQLPQLTLGETLARKPVQVIARQVGQQRAFVFAIGHLGGDKALQFFRIHRRSLLSRQPA
ncbi:hypothetical protein D3C72_2576700 [compost metagenome]